MDLLYSGWLDSDKTLPYSVFDTGTVAADAGQLPTVLAGLSGGYFLFGKKRGQHDNSMYANVPSMWRNAGLGDFGQVAHTSDAGFSFSAGNFDGRNIQIDGSNYFRANGYARVNAPSKGALYLHVRPDTSDTNGDINENAYDNGVMIHSQFHGSGDVYAFFRNDSTVWLAHTVRGYVPRLGFFAPNTVVYNPIGTLEPLRVYCVLSVPVVASGTVFDAAGRPAEGCRVFAYHRADGRLAGSGVSGQDGRFSFNVLAAKGSSLFLVCLDNDDAPDFPAQVQDRVVV